MKHNGSVGRGGTQTRVRDRPGVDRLGSGKCGCGRVVDPEQSRCHEGRRRSGSLRPEATPQARAETIHQERNDVRSAMNGFVIAVGTYVPALSDLAERAATKIGEVSVDMGNTACKVPNAVEYIGKARASGAIGK